MAVKLLLWLMVAATITLTSLALTGCGGTMEGTYEDRYGVLTLEFKSRKAYVKTMGGTVEAEYKVDGDKVIITNQMGNLVLTREADGSLSGAPGGTVLRKKGS